ncbi:MAG TPA: UDP-N-acetylmuramate dehydrogenase [Nevskiaceae bacterium]|nr:UDP-N-acetylmuramate dehydrogenase [Nevskiaceae bacterium]
MNILQNVPLRLHSTMRLGGNAAYMVDIHDRNELQEALNWAEQRNLPVLMVGTGSNIVWRDEGFPGLIMINRIMRFEEQQEDEENYYVTVGAGENWDSVVERTVAKGASGIESLSLIPGTAGATPVQNVGAYGQEIANVLVSVEAYDNQTKQFVSLQPSECALAYRTSRFKTTDRGRFFITAITLHLLRTNPQPPFYKSLQAYFDQHNIHEFTPQIVRDAVIAIRQSKLPDPARVANNGSFFANPIIDENLFTQIQADYPDVPHWSTPDGRIKLPAAWLVEQAGFKGVHDTDTGMATWPAQALVLVNEHAQSTAQLLQFKQRIVDKVQQLFQITLEQEPELLP